MNQQHIKRWQNPHLSVNLVRCCSLTAEGRRTPISVQAINHDGCQLSETAQVLESCIKEKQESAKSRFLLESHEFIRGKIQRLPIIIRVTKKE